MDASFFIEGLFEPISEETDSAPRLMAPLSNAKVFVEC
jgi:hypothetical protein